MNKNIKLYLGLFIGLILIVILAPLIKQLIKQLLNKFKIIEGNTKSESNENISILAKAKKEFYGEYYEAI